MSNTHNELELFKRHSMRLLIRKVLCCFVPLLGKVPVLLTGTCGTEDSFFVDS